MQSRPPSFAYAARRDAAGPQQIQPHWIYGNDGRGHTSWTAVSAAAAELATPSTSLTPTGKIRVISWNVDCLLGAGDIRMRYAMKYLGETLDAIDSAIPTVICFQEMTESDLDIIGETEWVRRGFARTDTGTDFWQSDLYGTTILVDKRLSIHQVFRVAMQSRMGRDGLFLDLLIPRPDSVASKPPAKIRICDVHLESLALQPPLRPPQMKLVAEHLHAHGLDGGVVTGDFNAIQDFDRNFHTVHSLVDTYLALGGQEDSDGGYTWGLQSPGTRFPPCRMDKMLCSGSIQPLKLERLAVGLKVPENAWKGFAEPVSNPFVTDHYALMGELRVILAPKI